MRERDEFIFIKWWNIVVSKQHVEIVTKVMINEYTLMKMKWKGQTHVIDIPKTKSDELAL